MKLSNRKIRKEILIKMMSHTWWGGKHTSYDNIPRGFPPHEWKAIRIELDLLIKEGFVIPKPTGYGLHVSLNVLKKPGIESIIFNSNAE